MSPWLLTALLLFAAAGVLWLFKGYLISPFLTGLSGFLLTCGFNLHPLLIADAATPHEFSPPTLLIVNLTGLLYLSFGLLAPRNRHAIKYHFRTRFFSAKTLVLGCTLVCLAALANDVRQFGTLPILASAQTFGTEYYAQSAEYSVLTFIGWSAGTVAFVLFTLDCCSSDKPLAAYIWTNKMLVALIVACILCNIASGLRYTLIGKLIIFGSIYELGRPVRIWLLGIGVVFAAVFFVLYGNLRFNVIRVEDKLTANVKFGAASNPVGWLTTYAEPILQNLENFITFAPKPSHGALLVSTIVPSIFHDDFGIERYSSATHMQSLKLYSHRGLTFRTFYPEFMMDFGVGGGAAVGGALLVICFAVFRACFRRPSLLIVYALVCPALFGVALLNEFAKLYTLVPFVVCGLIVLTAKSNPMHEAGQPNR